MALLMGVLIYDEAEAGNVPHRMEHLPFRRVRCLWGKQITIYICVRLNVGRALLKVKGPNPQSESEKWGVYDYFAPKSSCSW